jgi:outer membrane protein TolC
MYKYIKNTGVFLSFCLAVGITNAAYSKQKAISWLDAQINKDPEVIETKALLKASNFEAKNLTQAVYNPELEASYVRNGDFNNYSIGISQTIDFWDKRATNTSLGEIGVYASEQQLLVLLDSKKADVLKALAIWKSAKETAQLSIEREKQLQTLLSITEEKQAAGLLEPLDTELVYLNLSQIFSEIASDQIDLKNAELKVRELLPDWTPELADKASYEFGLTSYEYQAQWVEQHPIVQLAKAQWKAQQAKAELTTIEYKTNPSFGVSAGQDGGESAVGLTFSIPLNIRNNYSDATNAAYSKSIAAEANFRSVYRKKSFEAQANYESLLISQKYYQRWKQLIQKRVEKSTKLINARWEAGDINTADYLLALNQQAEGLHSGIQLEKDFRLSEISFIWSIGQLSKFEI